MDHVCSLESVWLFDLGEGEFEGALELSHIWHAFTHINDTFGVLNDLLCDSITFLQELVACNGRTRVNPGSHFTLLSAQV